MREQLVALIVRRLDAEKETIAADFAADQFVALSIRGIDVGDAPRFDRRVPYAQRRAVHVEAAVASRAAIRAARHDPHVLHSTPFERPAKVNLARQMPLAHVDAIVQHVHVPTADEPAVEVVGGIDVSRATGRGECCMKPGSGTVIQCIHCGLLRMLNLVEQGGERVAPRLPPL